MTDQATRDDRRRRVLVVDDNAGMCDLLVRALDAQGYAVQAAYNGWAALELLRGWQADLILLDLMMPVMDGWAFRREQLADEQLADIPVVVMSASLPFGPAAGRPLAADLQRVAVGLTAAAVLPKPFHLEVLFETIGQLTGPVGAS